MVKWRYRLQWAEDVFSEEIVQEASLQKYNFYNRQQSSVAFSLRHFLICSLAVFWR